MPAGESIVNLFDMAITSNNHAEGAGRVARAWAEKDGWPSFFSIAAHPNRVARAWREQKAERPAFSIARVLSPNPNRAAIFLANPTMTALSDCMRLIHFAQKAIP
jgi:hypothetical protein